MYSQEQIDALKSFYPSLASAVEGGKTYFVIKNLKLPAGCQPDLVTGLLCPEPRDGYPSRLFLSSKITHKGRGQNWNADGVMILGTRWWSVSWKLTRTEQTLLSTLLDHLEAYSA